MVRRNREVVMLSERERRALQEIEQQISAEDARFAASMQRPLWDRHYRLAMDAASSRTRRPARKTIRRLRWLAP
jgi:hypothetical protein